MLEWRDSPACILIKKQTTREEWKMVLEREKEESREESLLPFRPEEPVRQRTNFLSSRERIKSMVQELLFLADVQGNLEAYQPTPFSIPHFCRYEYHPSIEPKAAANGGVNTEHRIHIHSFLSMSR